MLRCVVLICCDRLAGACKCWVNMLEYVVLTCCDRLAGTSEFIGDNSRQIYRSLRTAVIAGRLESGCVCASLDRWQTSLLVTESINS